MTAAEVLLAVGAVAAAVPAGLRWLRVAQREHYLPGSVLRFAWRWWALWWPQNRVLAAAALASALAAPSSPVAGFAAAGAVAVGPFGLSVRGRTSRLAWTRRLRTLAATWAAVHLLAVVAATLVTGSPVPALVAALATPALVDLALVITAPFEARAGRRWVDRAAGRLRSVHPTVIGITGSYGKTSTKGYVAHLVEGTRTVLATPRSFNNNAGLARSVNEHLVPGTEVFVAEMGTYGPGEIASMVRWVEPEVAAITAIGPVHLERMRTEERIVEAKSEIFGAARTCLLNVDDDRLRALADRLAVEGRTVVRCSASDVAADVCVRRAAGGRAELHLSGRLVGEAAVPDVPLTNVAIAVAAAQAVGVPPEAVLERLPGLPTAANRQAVTTGAGGATIVDDTFNANPAGARAALALLAKHATADGRRVVVTPGMVELGPRQHEENRAFAAEAAAIATDVVVVGATNRRALLAGLAGTSVRVVDAANRDDAVDWVRSNLGPGDVVLYENDLPDHFA